MSSRIMFATVTHSLTELRGPHSEGISSVCRKIIKSKFEEILWLGWKIFRTTFHGGTIYLFFGKGSTLKDVE